MERQRRALLVQTRTRQKGYVYYDENVDLNAEKLQVRLVDDKMNETGDNLLCSPKNLTAIGHKD